MKFDLYDDHKRLNNNKELVRNNLQKLLNNYDTYIKRLLNTSFYAEFREYSVLLKELDAVLCFCQTEDVNSYNYLKKKNAPFAFNIVESFEKTLIHLMDYSCPIN